MKTLYFAFSILALPILAFSEAVNSQAAVPNLRKATHFEPKDYRCPNPTLNCSTTPSPLQQQQQKQDLKRIQEIKENEEMHLNRGTRIAVKKQPKPSSKNH